MKMTKLIPGCAVLAAGLFGTAAASAASVTQCGPNVCYTYDDAQVAVALTGLPTLVMDSMQFTASNFSATASGIGGLGQSGGPAGDFIFDRVYTLNQFDKITMFTVIEEFDYTIINGGHVEATLDIVGDSNFLNGDQASATQTYTATGDSGGNVIDQLQAQIYPGIFFTAGPATDIRVSVQNTLLATTNAANELASIQKKFTLATTTIMNADVVPVPAAVWLLGSGLGCLGMLRRRARGRR